MLPLLALAKWKNNVIDLCVATQIFDNLKYF